MKDDAQKEADKIAKKQKELEDADSKDQKSIKDKIDANDKKLDNDKKKEKDTSDQAKKDGGIGDSSAANKKAKDNVEKDIKTKKELEDELNK